ncbi:MAG: UDP-3-O-acylglucosamine N-acyltransferase [Planctomycetaceae bacterium]|nr:MAG: UDP-3-O-acylglucosamine N-acyltransferase [Planctomycetaceae bacterium]
MSISYTIGQLAALVNASVQGNAAQVITGVAALEQAEAHHLSFVQNQAQLNRLKHCRAGALIVSRDIADLPQLKDFNLLITPDVQATFCELHRLLKPPRYRLPRGIDPRAIIHPTAKIGAECSIGPNVVIGPDVIVGDRCELHAGVVIEGGCTLGDDVVLHPYVVLYSDVHVGNRVVIHAHTVLGADGFGYRFDQGRYQKIPQLGSVVIGDDVEIGASSTIDRATMGATYIGEGTKIDNLAMIAHNCQIGRHNVFAAQVGLAGSCVTEDYVRLAGQVGVRDHVHLHAGCSVGAKSGVNKDIPPGETWMGYPAGSEMEQKKLLFALHRLPQLREQVKQLTEQVALLREECTRLADEHRRAA